MKSETTKARTEDAEHSTKQVDRYLDKADDRVEETPEGGAPSTKPRNDGGGLGDIEQDRKKPGRD